ncbi:GIY-YIG nuclease family protein [Klebsiella pneumoniae]|uniref:GIY-YIG nuclease family protein n=5 Tax=Enterobacteriaceae TaxID=543 RepID=A0A753ZCL6_SALER|nr:MULTISPECIES: GIY-YIG nuclease family protein [Enterobacteriaceae]ECC9025541.1 GIY-YIG nuclease family protein [Salmonella enterica subsp. enterica]ECK9404126.1 GIY-YIG nuclease family protein [Salmonella enterica subsp. enterica serovar Paratyphi C str. CFSAN000603]EDV0638382.1 GIY-YIG nuclease family protein [Salmonella enterica subsp. enterica serovar Lexington]EEM8427660.1 GIY-YIG nuclease family protein [Salmonella enterica subsp. enterica serovar Essen]QUZ44410.1 GIY-YIG nuclease fami
MGNNKKYSIYILECCDGSYYTGITSDLQHRVDVHNSAGKYCAQHTKSRRPVKLVFSISNIESGFLARSGEKYIKSLTRAKKEKLIANDENMINLLLKRIFNDDV